MFKPLTSPKALLPGYIQQGLLLIILIHAAPELLAVDCIPDAITLSSQSDVDNFQMEHGPGCDRVVEDLVVNGADIVNLNGLSALTSMGLGLSIYDNPLLSSLDGLSALAHIDQSALISDNPLLTNVDGLVGLVSVGDKLTISNNELLASLTGLANLESASQIVIASTRVTTLEGLSKLVSVNQLEIHHNDLLTDMDALLNLANLESGLSITANNSLVHLNGLQNISGRVEGVSIIDNVMLESISALAGINTVGTVQIIGNGALQILDGLQNVKAVDWDLRIRENDALMNLDALSGIELIGNDLEILNNPTLVSIDGLSGLRGLGANPDFNCLFFGWCDNLQIVGNGLLPSLNGLANLASVIHDIVITDNASLSNCAALLTLLDGIDDWLPGPGPGPHGIPDVGGEILSFGNMGECNSLSGMDILLFDGFESH
jgi:hypothetical protein